jgi:DNA-binding GntR family transcriptional regulator
LQDYLSGKLTEVSLKSESLVDKVTHILEEGIINMTFPPGTNLVEGSLAETLDISRSPIREALLRLEEEGLVKKTKKSRVVVTLTKQHVVDYYEVWEMLHVFAGRIACKSATVEDHEKIRALLTEMKSLESLDGDLMTIYHNLNYLFHLNLIAPCRNLQLVDMHKKALKHIHWCWNLSISWPNDLVVSSSDHQKIFEAYCAKEEEQFASLVGKHIRSASKRFQREYTKKRGDEQGSTEKTGDMAIVP